MFDFLFIIVPPLCVIYIALFLWGNKTKKHVVDSGWIKYFYHKNFLKSELHRTDGPAIERSNGQQEWYLNGQLHREDGPALISPATGRQEWWQYNLKHRIDGPAVIDEHGCEWWYVTGYFHRVGGPAIIKRSKGIIYHQEWWVNGKLHRTDGPAWISEGCSNGWWLNGEMVTAEKVFDQMTEEQKEKAIWEINEWI